MKAIPEAYSKVPMLFRAQVGGRSQLQFVEKGKEPDAVRWAQEWISRVETVTPNDFTALETKEYTIAWRLLTNSGLDDAIIRPVVNAQGLPCLPGSSMKGMFRRACTTEQAERYCGKLLPGNDWRPGLLRFHGGYPVNPNWTEHLVDIIHPQQTRQVQRDNRSGKALAQISLFKPTLKFGISSRSPLPEAEWQIIWQIWEQALAEGIGSRVSAGYGQVGGLSPTKPLYKVRLKGQGQAPKLLTGVGEFRHNLFRGALRGHALRIFGGLTDIGMAERLVGQLFGDTEGHNGIVGLLKLQFVESKLTLGSFGRDKYAQPCYEVEGELSWLVTREFSDPDQRKALQNLVASLMQFAMILGGFGKSWRRSDHRKFYEDYYEDSYKALIGCHWEWLDERAKRVNVKVSRLEQIGAFLDVVRSNAEAWMRWQKFTPQPNRWAKDWREAWHPSRVEVWGRLADNYESSEAIHWFHGPYREAMRGLSTEGSIYQTDFAGKVG
jgi:CRISPR-associated protein Cmr6